MNCNYCNKKCIKKGWSLNKKQKYFCKSCYKYQIEDYKNKACKHDTNKKIVELLCNGCGIQDIKRVLKISTTTIIYKIKAIANLIKPPTKFYIGRTYEVDELRTYVKKKENKIWVCCAYERESKKIVSISVGRRNNRTLNKTLKPITYSNPIKIYTDKLKNYKGLIEEKIHRTKRRETNNVERIFLNFRTHIKRLCRKTICFSKSEFMLEAVLKIYLWRGNLIFQ